MGSGRRSVVVDGRDRRCFGAGGGHCSGTKEFSCTIRKVRDATVWHMPGFGRSKQKKLGSVVL